MRQGISSGTSTRRRVVTKSSSKAIEKREAKSPFMDLFVTELRDIYWAEKHLVKSLPQMARSSTSKELIDAFEEHTEITKKQVDRLEQVFKMLNMKPIGKKCEAMDGLVKEAKHHISELEKGMVRDAALITAAQKVEHYEMAAYGSLRTFAQLLQMDEAVELLQETLDEEGETDKLLTEIAESSINEEAYEED